MPAPPPTAEDSITLPRVYRMRLLPIDGFVLELVVDCMLLGGLLLAGVYFASGDLGLAADVTIKVLLCLTIATFYSYVRYPKTILRVEIYNDAVILTLRDGSQESISNGKLRSIRPLTFREHIASCKSTLQHRSGPFTLSRSYRINHSDGFFCFRPVGDHSFAPMIKALLPPPKDGQPISLPAAEMGAPRVMNIHTSTLCIISALGILQFLSAGFLWSNLFVKVHSDLISMIEREDYRTFLLQYLLPVTNAAFLLVAFTVAFVFSWREQRGAGWLVLGCVGVACVAFVAEVFFELWQLRILVTPRPMPRYQYLNWWNFIPNRELTPAFAIVFSACLLAVTALAIAISRRLQKWRTASYGIQPGSAAACFTQDKNCASSSSSSS